MSAYALSCPNCGGKVTIQSGLKEGVCGYCGCYVFMESQNQGDSANEAQEKRIQEEFAMAQDHQRAENYEQAGVHWDNILLMSPNHPQALLGQYQCRTMCKASTDEEGFKRLLFFLPDDMQEEAKRLNAEKRRIRVAQVTKEMDKKVNDTKTGFSTSIGFIFGITVTPLIVGLAVIFQLYYSLLLDKISTGILVSLIIGGYILLFIMVGRRKRVKKMQAEKSHTEEVETLDAQLTQIQQKILAIELEK